MDDLVAFLRARYDEDEAAAHAVLGVNVVAGIKRGKEPPRWVPSPEGDAAIWDTDGRPRVKYVWAREREHILRHDPARVLADIAAKQRILDEHAIVHRQIGWLEDGEEDSAELPVCRKCVPKHSCYARRADVPEGPCLTVRLLALPFADHEGYREEWRPDLG